MTPWIAVLLPILAAQSAPPPPPPEVARSLRGRVLSIDLSEQLALPKGPPVTAKLLTGELVARLKKDGWTIAVPASDRAELRVGGVSSCQALPKPTWTDRDGGIEQSEVYNVSCELRVEVIRAGTNEVIAQSLAHLDSGPASGVKPLVSYERTHFDLIRRATGPAIDALREELYTALATELAQGEPIRLRIRGVQDFTQVSRIQKVLSAVEGVRQVGTGELKEGEASYPVTVLGGARGLAEHLSGKKLFGRSLSAVGLTATELTCSLAP